MDTCQNYLYGIVCRYIFLKIRVRFFHDSPATLLHGFIYEFIFSPIFFFYRLLDKTQVLRLVFTVPDNQSL